MKPVTRRIAALVVGCVLVTGGALAQGRGRGQAKPEPKATHGVPGAQKKSNGPAQVVVVFSPEDRSAVSRYFLADRGALPPGLAKRDRLPPGLEKQIRVRGTLPPGLRSHVYPLPIEIDRQLRPLPTGYRRVVIGDDIVLMSDRTSMIYDVIRNAIRR
jgi:hypothetical protein